jgi:uncharacterized heparinase superfamily protein
VRSAWTIGSFVADQARLARTVRQLTLEQIIWRVLTAARFIAYQRLPALARAQVRGQASLRADALYALGTWLSRKFVDGPTRGQEELAAEVSAGWFHFGGQDAWLGARSVDWRPGNRSLLWRYQLHYFDYLVALALVAKATGKYDIAAPGWSLVNDWLRANPPGSRPGWEPYPTSIRLVNWAMAWAINPDAVEALDGGAARLADALAAQARFLERHVEFHIGGNHLIKNARALLVAGDLFNGPEAMHWRQTGRALLAREVPKQVLSDGGHYERSPLYQTEVLDDLLDCMEIDGSKATTPDVLIKMARWLKTMSHQDGGLALFNDTIAFPDPPPHAVLAYCARVTGRDPRQASAADHLVSLEPSGYYVISSDEGRLIVDCGEIGPPELAAHAHADALSFEFAWKGRRVVVDTGVADYERGPARSYVRSSRAHNTVVVDGADQSEVWAAHRAGRRARPLGASLERIARGARFAGAHSGYVRLGIVHCRHIVVIGPLWVVIDELIGRGEHQYASFVHLHPDLWVRDTVADPAIGPRGGAELLRLRPLAADGIVVERGYYCSAWGTMDPNEVIRLDLRRPAPAAFGYLLVPVGIEATVAFYQHERGLTIDAMVEGITSTIESERPAGILLSRH